MTALWNRLVTGDGIRKTRFHNYKGEPLDVMGLMYLPHSIVTAAATRFFGYRLPVPWLGWRGIKAIDEVLSGIKNAKVLEYGSGMSSLWLSRRCGQLVSVEHDGDWHSLLAPKFTAKGMEHVEYRRHDKANYPKVSTHPAHSFDFILIDGIQRDECAVEALKKIKPGGYLYLDNSDVTWNDYAGAEKILLAAANKPGGTIRYFNDFFPGAVAISQGLLVRVPA